MRLSDEILHQAQCAFSRSLEEHDDYSTALADAITAAAPLIVAAELRRMADELYEEPQRWPLALLRSRADELDPPGGAS